MSFPIEDIAQRQAIVIADLAQQMMEIANLRRAVEAMQRQSNGSGGRTKQLAVSQPLHPRVTLTVSHNC